jgi:hypothetical protein
MHFGQPHLFHMQLCLAYVNSLMQQVLLGYCARRCCCQRSLTLVGWGQVAGSEVLGSLMVVVMVVVKDMEAGQVMVGALGCTQVTMPDCQLPGQRDHQPDRHGLHCRAAALLVRPGQHGPNAAEICLKQQTLAVVAAWACMHAVAVLLPECI